MAAKTILCPFFVALAVACAAREMPLPESVPAFFKKNCHECHAGASAEAGLDLKRLPANFHDAEALRRWVRVFDRVEQLEMPPKDEAPIPAAERAAFVQTLRKTLTAADAARAQTVLRRLNRDEYENTLRDLFGINLEIRDQLPEDGKARGFDNIGEALDLSVVQMQRYMEAAAKVLDAAIQKRPKPEKLTRIFDYADSRAGKMAIGKHWLKRDDGAVVIFNNGGYPTTTLEELRMQEDGRYLIRIHGYAHQSPAPVDFGLYIGQFGRTSESKLECFSAMPPGPASVLEFSVEMSRGETLRIAPQNLIGFGKSTPEDPKARGMAVLKVEIEGPLIEQWPPKGHEILFGGVATRELPAPKTRGNKGDTPKATYEFAPADSAAEAARLLKRFIPLAFRRPVSETTAVPYVETAKREMANGASFEEAMRTAYIAVLCAPDFLFLREPPGKLDDYSLASRLSYMLARSLPDAPLLAAAEKGELARPDVLRAQTDLLLAGPRARRFTHDFVGQWLGLRDIDFTTPDGQLYPEYDEMLKDAMVRETEGFFEEVLRGKLSLMNFLESDWTLANERLAQHYGIEGVTGPEFRKVALKPEHLRGGVLTQASVLKVSANGTTTSPVVRGAWVLDRVLGMPPPPPPPGIPGVEPDIRGTTTLREQLDKHRALPMCNGCHQNIDPPGFALESYDVIGGWRDYYRSKGEKLPIAKVPEVRGRKVQYRVGGRVDASGVTAQGEAFKDFAEYKALLLRKKDVFALCLADKLASYASGRVMGFSDRAELQRIVKETAAKDYGFRELVHAVIQSSIFRSK